MDGLWRLPDPLLLASTSATRRALLASAAIPHEAQAPNVDERAIEREAGDDPVAVAAHLAAAKALAVSRARPGRLVLGGDQTLACEGRLFHKPADRREAARQIADLAGRTHGLHAAFALARDGVVVAEGHDTARLTMRVLDAEAIALYVRLAGDAALAGVGAYQLEGVGVHLFETVEGAHSTILGLPLLPLLGALRRLDVLAL